MIGVFCFFFFFKQKTAYEVRISDWSSDVCSSDLAILAHSLSIPGRRLPKGRVLDCDDLAAVRHAGLEALTVARLDTDDIGENDVAMAIAQRLAGDHVRAEPPVHGRADLIAETNGLLVYAPDGIGKLNRATEAITFAAVAPMTPVRAGDVVGTVKIIPYAVPRAELVSAGQVADGCKEIGRAHV